MLQVYLEVSPDVHRREVEKLTFQLEQERFNLQDIQAAISKVGPSVKLNLQDIWAAIHPATGPAVRFMCCFLVQQVLIWRESGSYS
jgi:hypothetical protein